MKNPSLNLNDHTVHESKNMNVQNVTRPLELKKFSTDILTQFTKNRNTKIVQNVTIAF